MHPYIETFAGLPVLSPDIVPMQFNGTAEVQSRVGVSVGVGVGVCDHAAGTDKKKKKINTKMRSFCLIGYQLLAHNIY